MPIIDDLNIKQRELALAVESSVNDIFKVMGNTMTVNFNRIWNNSDGLTPQEVMDSFGKAATELLTLADLCKQTLNVAVPGSCQLVAPYNLTFNPDGTVTVGDLIKP